MKLNQHYVLLLLAFQLLLSACSPSLKNTQLKIPEGELPQFFDYSQNPVPLVSAHRGGMVYAGYPENCIETYEYVLQYTPAIIECDVAMTKDSVLILMHDNTIDRTTTGEGAVHDLTWSEIQQVQLEDNFGHVTDFDVPLFCEVLEWAEDRIVLTVDVKRSVPFEKVVTMIEQYDAENYAAVIAYKEQDAQKVHRLNPDLMLSVTIRNEEDLANLQEAGIPVNRMVAFTGTAEADPRLYQKLHTLDILCILGTLGRLDKQAAAEGEELYRQAIRNGVDILATDRPVEAARAIRKLIPRRSEQLKYFSKN